MFTAGSDSHGSVEQDRCQSITTRPRAVHTFRPLPIADTNPHARRSLHFMAKRVVARPTMAAPSRSVSKHNCTHHDSAKDYLGAIRMSRALQ